jgi:streptogramin lyase
MEPNPVLTAAPDGSVWFSEPNGSTGILVRVDTKTGNIESFAQHPRAGVTQRPAEIVISSDATVWFVNSLITKSRLAAAETEELDRLTPNGTIVKVKLPAAGKKGNEPASFGGSLVADTSGNVWFLENGVAVRHTLAHESAANQGTNVTPSTLSASGLIPGPNGTMYFQAGPRTIGRVLTSAKVRYTKINVRGRRAESNDHSIFAQPATGNDGSLWFIRGDNSFVYRYTFPTSLHQASFLMSKHRSAAGTRK